MFGRNRSCEIPVDRRRNRFVGSRLQKLGAIAGFAAVLAACGGFGETPKQIGSNNLVTDHLPSATPTTSAAPSGEAAPTGAAVTTVTHPDTASPSPTQASPSRTPETTTAAPTTTAATTTSTSTPTPTKAARTEFAIDCAADPDACVPSGLPAYNYPGRGLNGEVYALNAKANGDASTGVKVPGSNEVEPLCKGKDVAKGILWLVVQTDGSWAQRQESGQGAPFTAYVEAGAVPGAADAVGACGSQDFAHALS